MVSSKTADISVKDFYADVLSEASRVRLETAREMEGIDEEIALLRVKFRDLLAKNPERIELVYKGMDMLMKAVTARYKLSPKSRNDLNDSIVGVINGIGRELWPEGGS